MYFISASLKKVTSQKGWEPLLDTMQSILDVNKTKGRFLISCHSFSPSRPQCHLSPLRLPSASRPASSPTPPSSPAATAAASPPSAAAAFQKLRAPSFLPATTRPTHSLPPPPCQTLSPAAQTSRSAGKTRPRPPTAYTRGTTPAGLCRCPTVSPFHHRRTPQPCHPSLTSCAQAAWSWREPPTLESPDRGLCPGRCPSYRCWFGSRSGAWRNTLAYFALFYWALPCSVFFSFWWCSVWHSWTTLQ